MMITYVQGDLFESPAQTLVNTVNTVGVMGKGVAKTFKLIFPDMFERYRDLCERGEIKVGTLFLHRTPHKNVLNFPTKVHWRNPSKAEYIEKGLGTFVEHYERMGIRSIAFPPLGCGNGELSFENVVRPIMERYLADLPIQIFVYAPHKRTQLPEHRQPAELRRWLRATPRDLPFAEVWEDLRGAFTDRKRLTTLTQRGDFEVQYVPDAEGLRVWSSKTYLLSVEELADIWVQLREFGFVTSASFPESRRREASYTLPILAELPYVSRIKLADEYSALQYTPTVGVQIVPVPEAGPGQRELKLA